MAMVTGRASDKAHYPTGVDTLRRRPWSRSHPHDDLDNDP